MVTLLVWCRSIAISLVWPLRSQTRPLAFGTASDPGICRGCSAFREPPKGGRRVRARIPSSKQYGLRTIAHPGHLLTRRHGSAPWWRRSAQRRPFKTDVISSKNGVSWLLEPALHLFGGDRADVGERTSNPTIREPSEARRAAATNRCLTPDPTHPSDSTQPQPHDGMTMHRSSPS